MFRKLLIILICTISYAHAHELDPPFINVNVGQIGALDDNSQDRLGIEYRAGNLSAWDLTPTVGLVINDNHSKYIYAQMMYNFNPTPRWIISPSLGLTLFDNAHDIDLGNTIEFRSGLEVAYKLDNSYRVGVAMYHLSNGGISSRNPGTESIVFSLNIPINPF